MVPNPDKRWGPCGYYYRLNDVITDDRYHIPHLMDINKRFAGKLVFSTIKLMHSYNQIPMETNDIVKTAIITSFSLWGFLRAIWSNKKKPPKPFKANRQFL